MNEILKDLPMHEEVSEALPSPGHGGVFSQLFGVVIASESRSFQNAESTLSRLNISANAYPKAQVNFYYWASRINIEINN